ncbi:hypothetical protein ACFWYW_30160 [Nonomuraea sp. NPDC059023]|uniref:hypothetical protein n=1 Tax=unclassified Nonomuraea TaxID=2593643 RepID=UPI003695EC47
MTCPALVVIPAQDPPGTDGGELMAAFRRGVRRDLGGLPGHIQVKELKAGHGMVTERPAAVAALVTEWLRP